jgi:hypothetical protein
LKRPNVVWRLRSLLGFTDGDVALETAIEAAVGLVAMVPSSMSIPRSRIAWLAYSIENLLKLNELRVSSDRILRRQAILLRRRQ